MNGAATATRSFGLSEEEIRNRLAEELIRAMRVEGERPTVHAIAHGIARILHEDHLRMLDQLDRARVPLRD